MYKILHVEKSGDRNLSTAGRITIGIINVSIAAACTAALPFLMLIFGFTAGAENWQPHYLPGAIVLAIAILTLLFVFFGCSVLALLAFTGRGWTLRRQLIPVAAVVLGSVVALLVLVATG